MKTVWKCLLPILVIAIGSGCASSGKQQPLAEKVAQQEKKMNSILEQTNRNAATIKENQNELSEITQRFSDLENRINTVMTDDSATTQEIKENLAFMNDQILRIDNTMRSKKPVPIPKAASVFKPDGFDVNSSYKGALDEYYSKRYESAISGFNEVLTVAPGNSLADNAQYWIGECYYGMGNNEKALEAFYKVFDFPESNKLADAHFKIGKTYLRMGNKDSAKEEFQAVVKNYPGTTAAKHAAEELGK